MTNQTSTCPSCSNSNEAVTYCSFHNKEISPMTGCEDHAKIAESDPRHTIWLQKNSQAS